MTAIARLAGAMSSGEQVRDVDSARIAEGIRKGVVCNDPGRDLGSLSLPESSSTRLGRPTFTNTVIPLVLFHKGEEIEFYVGRCML